MGTRSLNQIIKDTAFEVAVDYKPWEDDLEPQKYFEAGFVRGATYVAEHHTELVPVRMWQIRVFDDHDAGREPRLYTVPASTAKDAQLMALILDMGLENAKYNQSSVVERGEMELALVHTEVVSSSVCR